MIQRWMARFLQRRGWIVFWLDEPARYCSAYKGRDGNTEDAIRSRITGGVCWLNEYMRHDDARRHSEMY